MKIMYVINAFGAGGAERHLFELAKFMLSGGHSVTVVALTKKTSGGASDMKDDFVSLGAEVIFLDFDGRDCFGEFGQILMSISLKFTKTIYLKDTFRTVANFCEMRNLNFKTTW